MLRYSLGSLFLALLYLSIECAALVDPTGIWPQVAITLSIAVLVMLSLGAIFWRERRQVFAIGFAATGWLYILLAFSSVTEIRPYLLTETALERLFATMHGNHVPQYDIVLQTVAAPNRPPRFQTAAIPPPRVVHRTRPRPTYAVMVQMEVDSHAFAGIGHSMWAVIAAFVGGVTAQLFGRRTAHLAKSADDSTA